MLYPLSYWGASRSVPAGGNGYYLRPVIIPIEMPAAARISLSGHGIDGYAVVVPGLLPYSSVIQKGLGASMRAS